MYVTDTNHEYYLSAQARPKNILEKKEFIQK